MKNLIKKELESVAGNIDIAVTDPGLDTVEKISLQFIRGDVYYVVFLLATAQRFSTTGSSQNLRKYECPESVISI